MNKKSDRLLAAFSEIDEKLIEQSAPKLILKTKNPNLLKWISVAACFILMAGIGVAAWRSGILNPADAVSEPDDTPKVSDNITEPIENTNPVDSTNVTDTTTDPDVGENAIGGGSSIECPLHGLGTYVGIPGEFIDYVGEENFNIWAEPQYAVDYDNQRADGCICIVTFPNFVEHFDIPDEVIVDYYYNKGGYYSFDWDLDIILSRDWDAFDEYAQAHQGFDEEMEKRNYERIFKWRLLDFIEYSSNEEIKEYWNELTENGTIYNAAKWSIAEFVDKTSIDIDSLNSVLINTFSDGENRLMFEYDFSLLYDEGSMAYFLDNPDDLYPVQIDMLLHK